MTQSTVLFGCSHCSLFAYFQTPNLECFFVVVLLVVSAFYTLYALVVCTIVYSCMIQVAQEFIYCWVLCCVLLFYDFYL